MKRRDRRQLADQARRFLQVEGHRLFGQPGPAQRITFRRHRTVLFATLHFAGVVAWAVVKPLDEIHHVADPAALCALHDRVVSETSGSTEHLPWLHPGPAGADWLVTEFTPGRTLLACAHSASRRAGADAFDEMLARTADLLACIHRIPAAAVGLTPVIGREAVAEPNNKFLADFESLWTNSPLRRLLPRAFQRPGPLLERLGGDFADRRGDKLLIVDSQPKNIVVTGDGEPHFIDIDYSCGNPAMAVAHFLVSLDRLGLKRPLVGAGRIDRWKRLFVARYGRRSDPGTVRDILFFYPWLLLRVAAWHAGARSLLAPLLRPFYARRLATFCARVCDAGTLEASDEIAALFTDRQAAADVAA